MRLARFLSLIELISPSRYLRIAFRPRKVCGSGVWGLGVLALALLHLARFCVGFEHG